jgi:hypothetical protein
MTTADDNMLTVAIEMYRKMSLKELLAEENMMAKLFHTGRYDNALKKLHQILCLEIETRLQ